jgi:hypothetical protein
MGDGGMSGKVWMSSVLSNHDIGMKQGLRAKFYGHDWNPADFKIPLSPDEVHESTKRYTQGFALARNEFTEAAAVWDEKSFKKVTEVFYAGGFFVVRGKLAEVLSRFDLGEGGLIPFTIYKADLETPYPGEFFLLNFGCRKNSILPEQCGDARKFLVRRDTGQQVWHINKLYPDSDVVLSPTALEGPDLWFEPAAHYKIFLSDALAQALIDIGMSDVFKLHECRIAGGTQ